MKNIIFSRRNLDLKITKIMENLLKSKKLTSGGGALKEETFILGKIKFILTKKNWIEKLIFVRELKKQLFEETFFEFQNFGSKFSILTVIS